MKTEIKIPGKIYAVGGCVRDEILGVPSNDIDYVVVGASPDAMIESGFTMVGADFPVFLHPITKDEYALARTERKTGHGYNGFQVYAAPDVTLEEDLMRRDFTMNAIAKDIATGEYTDPYGGQHDLKQGILRHVSDAFSDDPLRVLRGARFVATYDLQVAPDTYQLMTHLCESGEMNHLVPERVRVEFEKGFNCGNPLKMWHVLDDLNVLPVLFPPEMCKDTTYEKVLSRSAGWNHVQTWAALVYEAYPKGTVEEYKQLMMDYKLPRDVVYLASTIQKYHDVDTVAKQLDFWTRSDARRQHDLWGQGLEVAQRLRPADAPMDWKQVHSICMSVDQGVIAEQLKAAGRNVAKELPLEVHAQRLALLEQSSSPAP